MKITNQQMLDLHKALYEVRNLSGSKFSYAVARNISKLNTQINGLNVLFVASESYQKYDEERADLAEKFSVKNEDGTPKIEADKYVLSDTESFDKELVTLKEKHSVAIEERKKQLEVFEATMKEEIDIELYTIPASYLPDAITASQISGILLIVEEEK